MKRLVPAFALLLVSCVSTQSRPADGASCETVAGLVDKGELKPAVDTLRELESEGAKCPRNLTESVKRAEALLADADTLVHSAQGKRNRGDLEGASKDLQDALVIYPKYYWAEKQLREVQQALSDEQVAHRLHQKRTLAARLSLARAAEARGDLTAATRITSELLDEGSIDAESRNELVEYARLLGLKLFSEGELTQARDLWRKALALDATNQKIRQYLLEVDQRLETLEELKSEDDG